MFGSWAMSMSNYIDNAGPNGDGTFCVQTFIQEDPRTEKQKIFLGDYGREFKPDAGRIPSAMSAAQGYDAIYLLAAAIKQAGSIEGQSIKEALENLKTPVVGVSSTYATPFSATDHIALKLEAGRLGMVRDGKVVPAPK
jgi:branched-chain amino acid transport system substrate-binding protein